MSRRSSCCRPSSRSPRRNPPTNWPTISMRLGTKRLSRPRPLRYRWRSPATTASLPITPLPAVTSMAAAPQPVAAPLPRVTPYAPTTAELSRQLLPNVRHAYGLAQHGAVYAAQTEFIQVLRRIAESKDAAEGVDTHAQALADGMRALDEADDFAPRGSQLEADVNVAVVASAHRTPVLQETQEKLRPAEAIALYHQFARLQLARAVGGEQAGSMSLYGLGKVQNRFARECDGQLQHERKALVMFSAALDAGPGNHLAANEIGVLLSRAGYSAEASELFRRAIDLAPDEHRLSQPRGHRPSAGLPRTSGRQRAICPSTRPTRPQRGRRIAGQRRRVGRAARDEPRRPADDDGSQPKPIVSRAAAAKNRHAAADSAASRRRRDGVEMATETRAGNFPPLT